MSAEKGTSAYTTALASTFSGIFLVKILTKCTELLYSASTSKGFVPSYTLTIFRLDWFVPEASEIISAKSPPSYR